MPAHKHYDYIVIGAGSSGCVAAYRLAQQSDASVLLIESGGSSRSFRYNMPIGFALLMAEGKANWNYQTVAEAGLAGRQLEMPRGRVLGGCSSINGMVYIRGQQQDFDHWAAMGNEGWSYTDVLPLFKRSENYYAGENQYHGSGGPLHVGAVAEPMAIADAFIDAAVANGIPRNEDFNGAQQEGVGYYAVNIDKGVRANCERAFLAAPDVPANLTVLSRFEVCRINFEGNRADSVSGYHHNKPEQIITFSSDQEIILSAGSYNSPKLLELSGIGAAGRLQAMGITPRVNLPEVGENLQDHCNNYVFYDAPGATTYYDHIKPLKAPRTLLQYVLRKQGIFANPAALVGAFARLDESSETPDCQVHFAAAASKANAAGKLLPVPGICASICRLQPRSRGSVHIVSDRHEDKPAINVNFLAQAEDSEFQLKAVRKLRKIMATAPISELLGDELPPLAGRHGNEELLQAIRENAESVHHPAGTCRMSKDENGVVEPDLKVKGVEGLRVADASIMPRLVSGNTHATCVMIGEKLAQLVLGPQQGRAD